MKDRFDVFLTKIGSVTRSDFYLETLSRLTQRTVMAARRTCRSASMNHLSRNNYYLVLALMLSGDISLNPGPVRFPCIECSKPVKSNQLALQCDFCDRWIHRKCTNPIVTKTEFRSLEQSSEDFYCHICVDRLPILSDSFFENSNITDETFSTNSDTSYLTYTGLSTNGESSDPSYDLLTRDTNPDREIDSQGASDESHDSSHGPMTRDTNTQDKDGDLHGAFEELKNLRFKNRENVIIIHLNVNSLRYKFMELDEILYDQISNQIILLV